MPKYGGWLGVTKRAAKPEPEDHVPPSVALAPSTTPNPPANPPTPAPEDAGITMNPHHALSLSAREDRLERERIAFHDKEVDEQIKKHGGGKLPGRTKMREKCVQIMALRLAGLSPDEISRKVGIAPRALRQYIYVGTKRGWITFEDPDEDLEFRIKHKIIRNVEGILDGTLLPNASMQEMTIAAAKGTKLFKGDAVTPQTSVPQMAIQINIVGAPGTAQAIPGQEIRAEAVGGTPAYLEAAVEPAQE